MFLTGLIPGILLCGTVLFSTIRKSAQFSRERDAFLYSKTKNAGLDKGTLALTHAQLFDFRL